MNDERQQSTLFQSPTRGMVSFGEMLAFIVSFIQNDVSGSYEIAVGSDSEQRVRSESIVEIDFVTAVTVRRIGSGGIFFYRRQTQRKSRGWPMRNRIYDETMFSATLAQEVRSHLRDVVGSDQLDAVLRLHVDVGEQGITRQLIGEVRGIAMGFGFPVVIKPEAYCAATVADRLT